MAEFCNQCAEELSLPKGDFARITSWLEHLKKVNAIVLCEGCGFILVDHKGNRTIKLGED